MRKRYSIFLVVALTGLSMTACSTLSFDKDRAEAQRKQELCQDIATRDQPQCSGTTEPAPEGSVS